MPRRALALPAVLLCLAAQARAASYPPELRFRTVSTDRVSVHFHQGEEAMAREAAALATDIIRRHEQRYHQSVGRVQIVLVDAEDDSNGFATPLPYSMVTLHAVAPTGADAFGNHEGWLRLALSHELAHVVHLEEAHGLWRLGRHLFGRAPFLFPNTLAMSWMIEGLATYEETRLTAFGRGRDPDSQMVVRTAALERRFPGEDQAIYAFDAWPGGDTPYVFGEQFLQWLSDEGGEETLPLLARQHSTQIIPFLDERTVGKVTGQGLHRQWKTWAEQSYEAFSRAAQERARSGVTETRPLTTRGIRQGAPRFSPDGSWIAYSSSTLTRFPSLRLVRPDGTGDRLLALRNAGSGNSWTPDGREVVFAELQVWRTFSVFGDLSAVDPATGRVRRLTRGLRAYDPDVSPDGRTIVFARKLGDRSDLFTVGLDGRGLRRLTRSVAGVEWSGPRFSPRGGLIVASRLLPGGWLDLVRVDPSGGEVEQLTQDRAKDVEPTFTPDGQEVLFRSDRDGASNLYALQLADRSLRRVTNLAGGAFEPCVSPDGRTVAFSSYSSRGYDLVLAPFAPTADVAPYLDDHPAPRPDPPPAAAPSRAYRPGPMLLPRFWTPWYESGGGESRIGGATGGSDPLYRHVWALQATYGTETHRGNATGYYVYDRFRTTFLVTGQDTSEPSADGVYETRSLNLEASFPLRRTIRAVQALSLTYRRERQLPLARPERQLDMGGIETAWTFSSAKTYPYSISPIDGGNLRLAWLHEATALGSDAPRDKLTADGRYYTRLFGSRDTLALRVDGGVTLGEPQAADPRQVEAYEQSFAVGGYPDASLFDYSATNLAVLRGYADNAFKGRHFAAVNLEYRFPLFSPQRGWYSLPVFLRHLRGTFFFDAADAFSDELRLSEMKTAAGASIGVDSALGYALPATAELTVARGFAPEGDTRVYLRFGLAF
ncbi:MAG TPA: BamA/TamA family outer membrane protein [Vicinamibacteria bacterium]|nr:BamA/TamA family outer membrane protein [Vicinamibacteria bacterium]